jgi:hypothetical protein
MVSPIHSSLHLKSEIDNYYNTIKYLYMNLSKKYSKKDDSNL